MSQFEYLKLWSGKSTPSEERRKLSLKKLPVGLGYDIYDVCVVH